MIPVSVETGERQAYDSLVPDAQDGLDLFALLHETARFLWKVWPMDMELSNISQDGNRFTIRGTCPHCGTMAAFPAVVNTFEEKPTAYEMRLIAPARCIACNEFILAIIVNRRRLGGEFSGWVYGEHYPLGKPDDAVDEDIPENIARDFSEALRCQWVEAYNATAEMCRRTVESSCINLGATYSKVLQEMIDSLHAKGIITEALKNVAHQIRLGGDRAAHPPEDPKAPPKYEPMIVIEADHANAIVEFTRHFLDHVYVIPKRLPTFDFSKPKKL